MKTKIKYILTVVFLTTGIIVKALATGADSIWISGRVDLGVDIPTSGTVQVTVLKESSYRYFGWDAYSVPMTGGLFTMSFPSHTEYIYATVTFYPEESKPVHLSVYTRGTYLFQSGDSLYVDVSPSGVSFVGRGAERMNCQEKIFTLENRPRDTVYLKSGNHAGYFAFLRESYDRIRDEKLAVLENCRKRIEPQVFKRLQTDIVFLQKWSLLHQLANLSVLRPAYVPEIRALMDAYYPDKVNTIGIASDPDGIYFLDFLIKKAEIQAVLKFGGRLQLPHLDFIFHRFKEDFSEPIREKLLVSFFHAYSDRLKQETAKQYYVNALPSLTRPDYRQRLQTWAATRLERTKLPDFVLDKMGGGKVNLVDFTGQVVVIDFWFTGCVPCRILDGQIAPISDYYKDDRDVSFVSVNVDSDSTMWLRSLKAGHHRMENKIHLNTGVLGRYHPFIEYLGFYSYPQILILDKKGHMVTMDVPRPKDLEVFKEFIESLR